MLIFQISECGLMNSQLNLSTEDTGVKDPSGSLGNRVRIFNKFQTNERPLLKEIKRQMANVCVC